MSDTTKPDCAKPTLEELRAAVEYHFWPDPIRDGKANQPSIAALDAYAREVARRAHGMGDARASHPKTGMCVVKAYTVDDCLRSLGLAEGEEG